MMIFKHSSWEKSFNIVPQKISILAVENSHDLWSYCIDLINQSNGEAGEFCILKDFKVQPFDKFCNVETNIPGLTLNTKKIQTALIKKCTEYSASPEFSEQLRKVSEILYNFCKEVCQDTGYSINLDEDIDIPGLFKLFSLSLKESFKSLLEKLIEYINVNIEFVKAKVFIFLFLTKFLSFVELNELFRHCSYQGVSIILIEEAFPDSLKDSKIPVQGLILDRDNFEITKNFSED